MQDHKLFAHEKSLGYFSVSPVLLILFLLTLLNHQVFGDPAIVVSNTNDSGAGSLRQAVADVDPGGNISFAAALNGQTILLAGNDITISKNLTIDASSLADGITISGNNSSRIFRISLGSVVTMEKLTIIDGLEIGSIESDGGGIFNSGDLTLIQSTVSDNSVDNDGGGIYNSGTLTLVQSTVSDNLADDDGGGISNENGASLTLTQSTVSGNASDDDGGGIYCVGSSTLVATNSTIANNSALVGGNTPSGGGIFVSSSTLTLTYCTIVGNSSNASGGGVRVDNTSVTIENTIVANNTASGSGADIELDNDGSIITPVGTNLIGDNDSVETEFPAGPLHGTTANPVDPLLAPLNNYGGLTETKPPLVGSPAIDPTGGATTSTETDDQIGSARVVDGDLIAGAIVDVGAVEAGLVITVTNANDDGPGSLRQSIDDASLPGHIVFDPTLSGQELQLTSGELTIPDNSLFTIDASDLPRGFTISGEGTSRALNVGAGSVVSLDSLSITGGDSDQGGGIYNAGILDLSRLTLFGNNASDEGGAIYNAGGATLTATNCTLVNNSAMDGGAIYADISSTAILQHCTITDNSANDSGGGLFSNDSSMTLENTIVAQNTASTSGSDIQKVGSNLTSSGTNLIGDNTTVEVEFPAGALNGTNASPLDPLLEVLGNYGGPTQTRLPIMGSPAIDPTGGATISSLETDQRGYPRAVSADGVGGTVLDIGAVESFRFVTVTNSNDSGSGSLREAIDAQTSAEPYHIVFDSSLNGEEIVLTSGQLEIGTELLTRIDASDLPDGLTISGNDTSRVFNIDADSTAMLESLTITGGNALGAEGGAINNSGDLMLTRSAVFGNTADTGGGIYTSGDGSFILINSTLVENSAANGGGIYIGLSTDAFLQYCTITDNDASGNGGGLLINDGASRLTIDNTIVAENMASGTGSDIQKTAGTVLPTGTNLIGDNSTVDTEFPAGSLNGTAANPLDPVLAPFGPYGGPTPTRPPFVYSPIIDPAGGKLASLQPTDQRGFDRTVDGDLIVGQIVDIGAVEGAPVYRVINNNDDGPGSLRFGLEQGTVPGHIIFDSVVNEQEIVLTTGELLVPEWNLFWLDTSEIDSVSVSGGDSSRVFNVSANSFITFEPGITLTQGNATEGGALYNEGNVTLLETTISDSVGTVGGGIYNSGNITLEETTVDGNSSGTDGGAIYNDADGIFAATNSTVSGSTTGDNGSIYNSGELTLLRSTVSGNSAGNHGGAIYSDGSLTVTNSTLVSNSAENGDGGGIHTSNSELVTLKYVTLVDNYAGNRGGGWFIDDYDLTVTIKNTIVAQNTAEGIGDNVRPDVGIDVHRRGGTINAEGTNLIGDNETVEVEFPESPLHGTTENPVDPVLAPLGPYGGPTLTRPALVGSPTIDPVGGLTAASEAIDQREETRVVDGDRTVGAILDIGAVEGAAVVTVTNTSDSGPDSLRQLIEDTISPGHIIFDPSLDGQQINLATELVIDDWGLFTLDATDLANGLALSGGDASRVFTMNDNSIVVLNRVDITDGSSDEGAGIYNSGDLTLVDLTVSSNEATSVGGGIYNIGSLTTDNVVLSANEAPDGAGIYNAGDSLISESVLSSNIAANDGGGIYNADGTLIVSNTTGSTNTADNGAGIYNAAELILLQSTLSTNTASTSGGALYNADSLSAINSTISGNDANNDGAGIYLASNSSAHITHCTIVDNVANASGGGLFSDSDSSLTLENSIVALNAALSGSDIQKDSLTTLTEIGVNFIGDNSTVEFEFPEGPLHGTNADPLDPLLLPLGAYDGGVASTDFHMPAFESPVIDEATSSMMAIDQQSFPRMVGEAPDLGAVEAIIIDISPEDLQIGRSPIASIIWTGLDGGTFELFLGLVSGSPDSQGNQVSPYQHGTLFAPAATYYWRVDTTTSAGITYTGLETSFVVRDKVEVTTQDDRDAEYVFGDSSLREAIAEVVPESLEPITFAPGLNGQVIALNGNELVIDKDLTLDASSLCGGITLSGDYSSRVLTIAAGKNVTINNATITRGNSGVEDGGGIFNSGNLTLSGLAIYDNLSSNNGGAIYNDSTGTLTVTNCTLVNNEANDGGGIYASASSTTTLEHCTLTDNVAVNAGGGLYAGANVSLANSIVSQNTASTDADTHENGGTITNQNSLVGSDPMLAQFGNYGGPTQTRPPLVGSPVINAGGATTLTIDQRGFDRVIGASADQGASESLTFVMVTNLNDSGAGSLRDALSSGNNEHIYFDPGLTGGEITLASQLAISAGSTIIDASTLPDGLIISGNSGSRVFSISANSSVLLDTMTITGGDAGSENGGGILNEGSLTLLRSTLTGNSAENGGGIYTSGSLKVDNCTIVSNSANNNGGAIGINDNADSDTFLRNCTIAVNSATNEAGGLFVGEFSGNVTLKNSIIAENTASSNNDISKHIDASITWTAMNLIGDNSSVEVEFPASLFHGTLTRPLNPLLLDLSDNGGTTQTMELLAGSPATDAEMETAGVSRIDQRGFARVLGNGLDLGAYESVAGGTFNAQGLTLHAEVDAAIANENLVFEISTDPDFSPNVGTYAGMPENPGLKDVSLSEAQFNYPSGIAEDSDGNLYIADTANHRIRMITSDGVISTIAGSGIEAGSNDGPGPSAKFYFPVGIAVGPSGNLYVADYLNHKIRKLTRPPSPENAWTVTTLAGSGDNGFRDDSASVSQFDHPYDVAVDAGGNVYVADSVNHRIRKITPTGNVSTFAGSGIAGSSDDLVGLDAQFNVPVGLAFNSDETSLFVADRDNNVIREIDMTGDNEVSTYAGTGSVGFDDGPAASATFDCPAGLAVDENNNLYVSDKGNHAVRQINSVGEVSTVGGSGTAGFDNGKSTEAQLNNPTGVVVDFRGDVVVADAFNHVLRRIVVDPIQVTVEVDVTDANGTGVSAFVDVGALGINPNLMYYTRWHYLTDNSMQPLGQSFYWINLPVVTTEVVSNRRPTIVEMNGTVDAKGDEEGASTTVCYEYSTDPNMLGPWRASTLAGSGLKGLLDVADDPLSAEFDMPQGLAVFEGTIYIADRDNHVIRKVSPDGEVSTFAGSSEAGHSDGIGTAAQFDYPSDIAVDDSGNLYIADEFNHQIRMITPDGVVTTVAGSGIAGFADGAAADAEFLYPKGVALDAEGNIYVADTDNHLIRKITSDGTTVSTLAGSGIDGFLDGDNFEVVQFSAPQGLTVDALGRIYVADTGNHRIRVISETAVLTLAGSDDEGFLNDAVLDAQFSSPVGVAVDNSDGTIYVTDRDNHRIRSFTIDGEVITVAGSDSVGWVDSPPDELHPPSNIAFNLPSGITIDDKGVLYVTEVGNVRLRRVERETVPVVYDYPLFTGFGEQASSEENVIPLLRGSTYYYRAIAKNGRGSDIGETLSFITPEPEMQVYNGPTVEDVIITSGDAIDFGTTQEDVPVIRQFTIANLGDWVLLVSDVNVPAGYQVLSASAFNVEPGDSFTIEVAMEGIPETIGLLEGLIEIVSDDPEAPDFSFSVSGEVYLRPRILDVDASANTFTEINFNALVNPMSTDTEVVLEYSQYGDVDKTFEVITLAGSTQGFDDTACGTGAQYDSPADVAVDDDGNVYIADTNNHVIRKITPDGTCSILAGSGNEGLADGQGIAAEFSSPEGITVDSFGNVYVADTGNNLIRQITETGEVTTIAGKTPDAFDDALFTDGIGSAARFNEPTGITVDLDGFLYVADYGNHRIRKVDLSNNEVFTVAGPTEFDLPRDVVIDTAGNIYVADSGNNRIQQIDPQGVVTTLTLPVDYSFDTPSGLALDSLERLHIVDQGGNGGGHRIIRIEADDTVTPLAGLEGYSGNRDGVSFEGLFNLPTGIAINASDRIIVADTGNHLIRELRRAVDTVVISPALSGIDPLTAAIDLAGLEANIPYYYRVVATNLGGTTYSESRDIQPLLTTPENDFRLLDLAVNQNTVDEFDPYTFSYVAVVGGHTTVLPITATVNSSGATLELLEDGVPLFSLESGVLSDSTDSPLDVGLNFFEVNVTSADGSLSRSYFITVIRLESPYADWQVEQFGIDADDPTIADPAANPTGDGICNLLKYAFDLDPTTSSQVPLPEGVVDDNGTPEDSSDDTFTLTYTKVLAATDLVYEVRWSEDMITWTTTGITEVVVSDDGITQQVVASVPIPAGGSAFMCIHVSFLEP